MAKKTDAGAEFGSGAYLVVPDPDKPSTWKLRVEESPGKVTKAQLGRAAAALGKGFRGNKVQLSQADKAKALRKLRGLYRSQQVSKDEMPAVLQQAMYSTAVAQLQTLGKALLEAPGDATLQADMADALDLLQESLWLDGLSAMLNGTLSMETVCASVQAALQAQHQEEASPPYAQPMEACPYKVAATFPDAVIYCDSDGKNYQQSYHMEGTEAILEGEPTEVVFTPNTVQTTQEAATALVEARPSGTLRLGSINRALNIIEGTTLIGPTSVNGKGGGRRYSEAALKKIAQMAEGLPGYLNHTAPDLAFKPRDVKDLAVRHRNVRYDPATQTVKSDMYVTPHHADLVFGLAEQFGDHIGNSLVSKGVVTMEGDVEVVQDVVALRSADLVSDPASTRGLFEGREATAEHPITIMDLIESIKHNSKGDTAMDFAAILTHLKANPDQQKLLLESLQVVPKADLAALEAKHATERKTLEESISTITVAKDKAEAAVRDGEAKLQEAQAKLDEHAAKDALAAKRVRLQEAIGKHKITTEFGKVQGAVSDSFRSLLEGVDEAEWGKYLDDRHAALKGVPTGQQPTSRGKDPKETQLSEGQDGTKSLSGAHAKLLRAAR